MAGPERRGAAEPGPGGGGAGRRAEPAEPAELDVHVLCARALPRGLRRPSAVVQLGHGGRVLAESGAVWRETAPAFAFRAAVRVPRGRRGAAPALDVVLRDRSAGDAELGRARVALVAPEARGWFPLLPPPGAPPSSADVLLAVRWPGCPRPHAAPAPADDDREADAAHKDGAELRAVHPRPGRLFRAGAVRVEVLAHGVPVSLATPFLALRTADQVLRAGETGESRARWEARCGKVAAGSGADGSAPGAAGEWGGGEVAETDDGDLDVAKVQTEVENLAVLPHGSPKNSADGSADSIGSERSSASGKDLLKAKADTAIGAAKRLRPTRSALRTAVPSSTLLQMAQSVAGRRSFETSRSTKGAGLAVREQSANVGAPGPKKERPILAALLAPRERREVDFGSFSFALLQGVFPSYLKLTLANSNSPLPEPIATVFDQEVELPVEILGFGSGPDQTKSHDMQFSLCEKGPAGAKISFSLRVTYIARAPSSHCNIVTPRFRELLRSANELAPEFKKLYPKAEGLTYLFVGGLFTNHYPTYFTRNIDYLQEKLCLPRVQSVPIHTESGVASNATAIRDAIAKTCSRRKSIVLIGHSKGGVDILEAVSRFPEIVPFVYGIITLQAPYSGSFVIDFLARSQLAVKAISGAIETLWRGEKESFQDMSYSARDKELELFEETEETEIGDKDISTDSSEPPKESPSVFQEIPIVSVSSCAPFEVYNIRSAANAAGVASMAPIAQLITKKTGFRCDGLVVPVDARVPFCDLVYLEDMMHTEPALYVRGTKYPPGEMTASVLVLLFEKAEAMSAARSARRP